MDTGLTGLSHCT